MHSVSWRLVFVLALLGIARPAQARDLRAHVEVDPLPFGLGGYGLQLGVAHRTLPGWRIALGNFSLDVPDFSTQLRSVNDGFHLHVRRSHALYLLRFFSGLRGFCVGGSLRYLRQEFTHDDAPGQRVRLGEISVEAIGGYKWHPFAAGFYLMPWLAVAKPLHASNTARLAGREYQPDFVQLFATVNIGWQL